MRICKIGLSQDYDGYFLVLSKKDGVFFQNFYTDTENEDNFMELLEKLEDFCDKHEDDNSLKDLDCFLTDYMLTPMGVSIHGLTYKNDNETDTNYISLLFVPIFSGIIGDNMDFLHKCVDEKLFPMIENIPDIILEEDRVQASINEEKSLVEENQFYYYKLENIPDLYKLPPYPGELIKAHNDYYVKSKGMMHDFLKECGPPKKYITITSLATFRTDKSKEPSLEL